MVSYLNAKQRLQQINRILNFSYPRQTISVSESRSEIYPLLSQFAKKRRVERCIYPEMSDILINECGIHMRWDRHAASRTDLLNGSMHPFEKVSFWKSVRLWVGLLYCPRLLNSQTSNLTIVPLNKRALLQAEGAYGGWSLTHGYLTHFWLLTFSSHSQRIFTSVWRLVWLEATFFVCGALLVG